MGEPVIRGFSPGPVVLGNATGAENGPPTLPEDLAVNPKDFQESGSL